MNPDLVLEVPDTPDRISKSIEILPNRLNRDHKSRHPNLSLKQRITKSLNSSTSTPPNNNTERKRKSVIDVSSSNSDHNKRGKRPMQEVKETSMGPTVRDNKGKGKMNLNNDDSQEISPVPGQAGISLTPRRVGKRWLVRNGCISPGNISKRNAEKEQETGGFSNGGTGDDGAAQKASEGVAEAGRKTRVQLPVYGVSRKTGEPGPRCETSGPGPRHETSGPGPQSKSRRENAGISEIVAGDLYEGLTSSRNTNTNTPRNTNTDGWRTTANHRSGSSNQNMTDRSRPNPVITASSVSNPVRTQPPPGTSTNNKRENGACPSSSSNPTQDRGRGKGRGRGRVTLTGSSSSSNPTRNPVVTDLTTQTPTRGRVVGVRVSEPGPVIDLDAIGTPGSIDSGLVRARQVAHDEWLAWQLQEEFNNESHESLPILSMEEMDARIAMSLQQEENARRQRGSVSSPPVAGRAGRRLRGRRDAFHEDQFHFVAAVQQMHHDFNENDYETLLALDENNHMHTGATRFQINNLPESVVHSDNFEEPCTVCLEKPSIGDTIRHLPCLHKFHKDCIDQWLQRKKECPVCKCSIS